MIEQHRCLQVEWFCNLSLASDSVAIHSPWNLRRFPPRKKRRSVRASGSLCGGLELDGKAELGETRDEMLGFGFGRTAIEVVCAEVVVLGAVLEHVIDGGEDRGGDGADGFLRATPVTQAKELSLVVAALLADGGPGALDQHRLEPGRAPAHARGGSLAGTLGLG